MIDVLASVTVKDGKVAEFLEIFNANVPKVLEEQGCISYRPVIDLLTDIPVQDKNPCNITIIEQWDNLEALELHLISPHMMDYKEDVKDIVSAVKIKILQNAA